MMTAPSVALYGSSPPGGLYTGHSPGHARSLSPVDFDFKAQTRSSTPNARPVKGGLSCLFATKSAPPVAHGSANDGSDSPVTSSSARGSLQPEASSTWESSHTVGSAPVNIPSRGRSPVSVFWSGSSSRSSHSYGSPVAAHDTSGLPPADPHAHGRRRRASWAVESKRAAGRMAGVRSVSDSGDTALMSRFAFNDLDIMGVKEEDMRSGILGALDGTLDLSLMEEAVLSEVRGEPIDEANGVSTSAPVSLSKSSGRRQSFSQGVGARPGSIKEGMLEVSAEGHLATSLLRVKSSLSQSVEQPPAKPQVAKYLAKARARSEIFYDPLVVRAFNVAATAHEGQMRRNGEPYLAHCVETALILSELCPDKVVVAAGLLHDVLDDTLMTEEKLHQIFGDDVVKLVSGVSKVGQYSQLVRSSSTQLGTLETDNLRTMFLAMTDVRVFLVKLADRLHNLRTLDALPLPKRQGIAKETLDVFVPLARRLGIWLIKAEMEDLCFKYVNPVEYGNLKARLAEGLGGEESVQAAVEKVDATLRSYGVEVAGLSGRPKNLYSIHKKMESKGRRSLDDIYDLRAIRIIVPDIPSCYSALEVVHRLWSPVPTRFKDYVKSPKSNGYQSLHTVVRDDSGCALEVQIRTADMHRDAEFGVAAHWKYKERKGSKGAGDYASRQVEWARWMISWYLEISRKVEVIEDDDGGGAVRSCKTGNAVVRPPCPFPEHEGECPFVDMKSGFPRVGWEDEEAPVLVIEKEGDSTTVRELAAGATAGDLVNDRIKRGLPAGAILRPLINCEVVDSVGQPLTTGDMVELVLEYTPVPEIEPELLPALSEEVLERKASFDFRKQLLAMNITFNDGVDHSRGPPTPTQGTMSMARV